MCIGLIQLVQDVTLNRFQFGDESLFKHLLHLIKLRILNRTFNMNDGVNLLQIPECFTISFLNSNLYFLV